MNGIISPALVADLASLAALKEACVARMRADGIDQWDDVYPNPTVIAADIDAAALLVLRVDDTIAGCLTLDEKLDPLWTGMDWSPVTGPVGAVHRVMVHPSRQGRGLARQLMRHAEVLARCRRWTAIRLDAFTANPGALALYDGLGYRRTGTAQMRKGPFVCFEKVL